MKKPLLSELTLRQKIGQMLMSNQRDINRRLGDEWMTVRTEEEKKVIYEYEKWGTLRASPGGENRGMNDRLELNPNGGRQVFHEDSHEFGPWMKKQTELYEHIPYLISIDAERDGAGTHFDDLTKTCPPLAIAAANSEELTYKLGAAVGRELHCIGVNWRWAPVVDIANRYASSVMRNYSLNDVDTIVKYASATIRGTQSEGVATAAKHFPGGDRYSIRDTHFCPSVNSTKMDEWWDVQGKIWKGVIDAGVYSIMTSHTSWPACDDEKINGQYVPVTLSKKAVTDVLKGELGFKGVVLTDALEMNALIALAPYDELIVRMVNAGHDALLSTRLKTGDIIEAAVKDGRIPESRIDDACQRILDMKEKLGMFDCEYEYVSCVSDDVSPECREINKEIARRAVTLVRDRKNLLPVDKNKIKKVSIICSTHEEAFYDYQIPMLEKAFKDRGIEVYSQRRLDSDEEIRNIARDSDLIIYAAYVADHAPYGGMNLYGDECKTYFHAFTSGKEKSIGVSFGWPYIHYDIMEQCDTFVNAYGKSRELIEAFVESIFGEIEFKGKSPLKLEPDENHEW